MKEEIRQWARQGDKGTYNKERVVNMQWGGKCARESLETKYKSNSS